MMVVPVRASIVVYYHMPAHPALIQMLLWQCDDVAPRLPRVARYLDHWRREIWAVVADVEVALAETGSSDWHRVDVVL